MVELVPIHPSLLKKNVTRPVTPRRFLATSQLVPTTQTGEIKKHEGRGFKVACQAYSSIFHTHTRASDLVKVSVRQAAPPQQPVSPGAHSGHRLSTSLL